MMTRAKRIRIFKWAANNGFVYDGNTADQKAVYRHGIAAICGWSAGADAAKRFKRAFGKFPCEMMPDFREALQLGAILADWPEKENGK